MPCDCANTYITKPPHKDCSDCLILPSVYLKISDSPEPCGDTVQIDLLEHAKTNPCVNPVEFEIFSYNDTAFQQPTITGSVMTVTTKQINYNTQPEYKIIIKATCEDYGTYKTVRMPLKDPCIGVDCGPGEECDECGNCQAT